MRNNLAIYILLTTFVGSTLALPSYAYPSKASLRHQTAKTSTLKAYQNTVILYGYDPSHPPPTPAQIKKQQADLKLADFLEAVGKNLINKKQYASAESDFRQVVTLDPSQTRALDYALLADIQSAQDKTAEAIQTYHMLFYELPMQGVVSSSSAEYKEEARKEFRDDPTRFGYGSGTVEAWMHYIVLLSQTGQWREAVHFYSKASPQLQLPRLLKIAPDFDSELPEPQRLQSAAHLAMGVDYVSQELYEQAWSEYHQALQLEPGWAEAYYCYGVDLQNANHKEDAKAAFTKAASLGSDNLKAFAQAAINR